MKNLGKITREPRKNRQCLQRKQSRRSQSWKFVVYGKGRRYVRLVSCPTAVAIDGVSLFFTRTGVKLTNLLTAPHSHQISRFQSTIILCYIYKIKWYWIQYFHYAFFRTTKPVKKARKVVTNEQIRRTKIIPKPWVYYYTLIQYYILLYVHLTANTTFYLHRTS